MDATVVSTQKLRFFYTEDMDPRLREDREKYA